MKPLLRIACFALAIVNVSCSRQPVVDDVTTYTERLANVLDLPAPAESGASVQPFPAKRDVTQSVPQLSMKLREFYALQPCPVATLIAERNTALGRTQLPSTRYVYETRLLSGLQDCIDRTQDKRARQQLAQWLKDKREALPLVWSNLVQGSDETKRAFLASSQFFDDQNRVQVNDTVNAFAYLIALADKNRENADAAVLETHLQALGKHAVPGKVHFTQVWLSTRLASLTPWLVKHTQSMSCDNRREKQAVEYLANVFNLFFVDKIQPYASALNSAWYKLSPAYQTLVDSPHTTSEFKQYLSHHQAAFARYQSDMREHVEFWQGLFKRCGIMPAALSN